MTDNDCLEEVQKRAGRALTGLKATNYRERLAGLKRGEIKLT